MHVISRKTLSDYWQKVPEAEQALKAWFCEAQKAHWASPAEIKEKYRSASFLKGNRIVFNICGNKHRLIVRINYASKTVFVRFVGSHSDYDKIKAEEV
ncbi:MAG: type II toxin-antitoxin system HigB family toxin [Treponema sp.]|nr:type II toxin-antitoxin system HigB family toxin [Treponema sp.]